MISTIIVILIINIIRINVLNIIVDTTTITSTIVTIIRIVNIIILIIVIIRTHTITGHTASDHDDCLVWRRDRRRARTAVHTSSPAKRQSCANDAHVWRTPLA